MSKRKDEGVDNKPPFTLTRLIQLVIELAGLALFAYTAYRSFDIYVYVKSLF